MKQLLLETHKFVNLLSSLQQSDSSFLNLDSQALAGLPALAINDAYLPGAASRNILHASGVLEYTEPINLNLIPKSGGTGSVGNSKLDNTDLTNSYLEVYPNPAADYCIARYSCMSEGDNYLQITDINGQVVDVIKLKGKKNSVVVPLKSYVSGTYLLCLICNGKCIQNIQVIVR